MHRGPPPPPDAAAWHVFIAGASVGPLRAALVVDLLERGSLGDEPIVWRAGFERWRRIAEVEPFVESYRRWQQRRPAIDPIAGVPRTEDPPPTATRPIGAVELVVEIDAEPAKQPRARVSRLAAPREESTDVFSLDALRERTRTLTPEPPQLPAFPPTALAAIAVPVTPAPVHAPPPKTTSSQAPLYLLLFLLMASIGGLAALLLLRDHARVGPSSERADLVVM